ncbi:MAG: insulinase family protein [Acidobacteria bacterium]|nr:insulinase family protein [Acidobacteriota bacterium]
MTPAPAPRTAPVDRSRLPVPGPARSFTFPRIEKSALANGLRVWTVPHPGVPLVAFTLLIQHGAATDPPGMEGLAAVTADMLDEGSGDRSAIEMHEALARLGAQFDTDIGSDATVASLTVLTRFAARALGLLSDIVARPALREQDFLRVRQLRLHRLTQLRDMPGALADRAFLTLLYGAHPYGHLPIGTEASLTAMTPDDVRAFHAEAIRPAVATLIAAGDCDHATVVRLAADAFGDWTGSGGPGDKDVQAATVPPAMPRLHIVPRPKAPQSELRIGQVSAARDTPDYHALVVANTILGGQFVSRINLNLREDKGLTYGARTAFEFRRLSGPFVLQAAVQTSGTARAIEESIAEIAGIRGARPVTGAELELGIAALTRGYARNFETADQFGRAALQLALYDLPDDYFAQFVTRVERVTSDEVSRVMTRHLDPARLTTLVVGDVEVIGQDLTRLGFGEPVVLPPDAY